MVGVLDRFGEFVTPPTGSGSAFRGENISRIVPAASYHADIALSVA
jgi:hypothetical protein